LLTPALGVIGPEEETGEESKGWNSS